MSNIVNDEKEKTLLTSYGEPKAAKEAAKIKSFEYNNIPFEEYQKKDKFIKEFLGKTGKKITIISPFHCDFGYNIEIGENFFANMNLVILDGAKVDIGDNVYISPNVSIYTVTLPLEAELRIQGIEYVHPVSIGNNVWIGAGSIILPGVSIGENTVIKTGSVVTRNIPADVIAGGNPCRVERNLTPQELG